MNETTKVSNPNHMAEMSVLAEVKIRSEHKGMSGRQCSSASEPDPDEINEFTGC